ncbi:hypothetical protein [Aquimarina sediminis]|uniref:hypothetical protein n=1 Tax=Aquimarina sediminis TaxID=2070536 RepID=UPI000CA0483A|nr:hypothetical protein [Aquimarina sediminis]
MKYKPSELIETIGLTFFRRHIMYGLKGSLFPVYNWGDWIIHARYLLTVVNTTHIDDLFELSKKHDEVYGLSGVWIASLLKERKYIPAIIEMFIKCNPSFLSFSLMGCLAIYADRNVAKYVIEVKKEHPALRPRINYFLKRLDELYETSYSIDIKIDSSFMDINRKQIKVMNNVITYSAVIRAYHDFNSGDELKASLEKLLRETTPPRKFPLLRHNKINHYPNKIRHKTRWLTAKMGIRDYNAVFRLNRYKQKYTSFFSNSVTNYMYEMSSKNEKKLKEALKKTTSYYDILSGIESDYKYRLPCDIIDSAFQKLLELINPSYQVLEQYAIQLLLHGTQYDEKAKRIYDQAQRIKSKYTSLSFDDHNVRMDYTCKL